MKQSPREIASKLIVRLGISPEGGERYVGYAEEAIYEAIDADRAARGVTVTDDMVMRALGAKTEETPESLQYVLIRGLSAMGYAHPSLETHNLMRAALEAVGHIPSPSPDTLGRVVEECARVADHERASCHSEYDSCCMATAGEIAHNIRTSASEIIAAAQAAPESDT